jgi:hypothetical protein
MEGCKQVQYPPSYSHHQHILSETPDSKPTERCEVSNPHGTTEKEEDGENDQVRNVDEGQTVANSEEDLTGPFIDEE